MRDGATETDSWYLSVQACKNTPLENVELRRFQHPEKERRQEGGEDAQHRAQQAKPICAEPQLPRS